MKIATAAAIRAYISSCRSEMLGISVFFSRSWLIEVEMTSSSPAAVDNAAARPPAATSAITQPGSLAISGLASTMMSRSTYTSLTLSVAVLVRIRAPLSSRMSPS